MTTLWLVGVTGAGKSTAGRIAAIDLGVPFWDTDELIEADSGAPVAEIWTREGEEAFRALEAEVVARLSGAVGIVATGGGAVLDPANRAAMKGTVIWLTASPTTVAERIDPTGRPLLAGANVAERIEALLEEREHLYEEMAGHILATDGLDVRAVADRIARLWPE